MDRNRGRQGGPPRHQGLRRALLAAVAALAVFSAVPARPASAAPAPPAPFTAWAAFVDHSYEVVLGAVPTTEQRAAAAAALQAGSSTAGGFVADLRTAPDQLSAVDPTVRLYRAFFLRIPDRPGLTYWIAARRTGTWTLVRMSESFATSNEFRQRYGDLSNRAFVTRIYEDVLQRPADPAGVDFWTAQLDARRRSRGSVMAGFSESDEYVHKQASEVTASVLPVFLLGRSPTGAEFDTWVGQLDGGRPVADLASELVGSPAFTANASRQRVVVFGDSVPRSIITDGTAGTDLGAYDLVNAAIPACDGADRPPPARTRFGDLIYVSPECASGWTAQFPPWLRFATDRTILMTGQHAMLDHKIGGTWQHPCHAGARAWYHDDIVARLTYLARRSPRTVLVLPAWPGPNSIWILPTDYVKRADCVRQELKRAAADTHTPTVDLGARLCPSSPTACGSYRSKDGVHIDAARSAEVLTWLLAATSPPAG